MVGIGQTGQTKNKEKTMKKMVITLLMATMAGALTFGAAASLSVSANDLGSGGTLVAACDTDGINVVWTDLNPLMHSVDITGVDDRCDGQELAFTVDGDLGPATNYVTIPLDPGVDVVTVPIPLGINSWAITSTQVTISGAAN